jgi:hypothetical protein
VTRIGINASRGRAYRVDTRSAPYLVPTPYGRLAFGVAREADTPPSVGDLSARKADARLVDTSMAKSLGEAARSDGFCAVFVAVFLVGDPDLLSRCACFSLEDAMQIEEFT